LSTQSLGTGGVEHPEAELIDQAAVFRDRDEFRRRDHAAFRMPPPQQCLAARDIAVLDIDHRLIVNLHAAVGDRLA
jgi:hypothetical protein